MPQYFLSGFVLEVIFVVLICLFRGHSTTTWMFFYDLLPPPPCVDSFYILSVD